MLLEAFLHFHQLIGPDRRPSRSSQFPKLIQEFIVAESSAPFLNDLLRLIEQILWNYRL